MMRAWSATFVLLAIAVLSCTAFPDSARRAGNPRKDDALYFNPHIGREKGRGVQQGAALVSSSFASGDEGWQSWMPSGQMSGVSFQAGHITIASSGSQNVYFSSPSAWSGDRSAAYNGKLTFRTGATSSTGSAAGGPQVFDIALVAQCGYALTLSGKLSATQTQTYTFDLHEDADWIDSRTGKKPNMFDFLGVLANLQAVRIRASLTSGDETGALYDASLLAGRQWHPCCTLDDTVDICTKAGAPYYNPPTLKFYCEGSLAQPVRVKTVFPRFARRTGGASITVYGENFGLEGSTPIVRIGGVMCQRTVYPGAQNPVSGNKGPIQEDTVVCTSPVHEGFDQGVTVQAASGSVDSPYQVRQSADRTVWEVQEAQATSCLSDDTRGFEFGAHDFTWAAGLQTTQSADQGKAHPVGVDRNTGDIFVVMSASDGSNVATKFAGAHMRPSDDMAYTCPANTDCEILYKFSRDGSPLWAAIMHTGANEAEVLDITSVYVDESDSPPSVYLAGTYKLNAGASDTSVLKVTPGVGKSNTVISLGTAVTISNIQSATKATPGNAGTIGVIIRYDSDGAVKWVREIVATSETAGFTAGSVRLHAYRPSTSNIINHHTQGDEPSNSYILGKQKDNGGIYVSGITTVGSGSTVHFGYEPAIYKGSAALDAVTITAPAAASKFPFVAKYDKDGAAVWARGIVGASTMLVAADAVKVHDVAAGNDLVFLSISTPSGKNLKAQTCEFRSKIEGGKAGAADLSENSVCALNVGQSLTNTNGAVVVAFDASGVYKWHAQHTASTTSDNIIVDVSLSWARSFRGGRPLSGNVQHWDSHETLLGRRQPDMGRVNDLGSENRDESISDGTWLYVATSFSHSAGSTVTVAGLQFPEVGPSDVTVSADANGGAVVVAKYDAATGTAQWAKSLTYDNADGDNEFKVSASDIQVDDQTGAVFIAGSATRFGSTDKSQCNVYNKANDKSVCGFDLFGLDAYGDVNRLGCPADPRKELNSDLCYNSGNVRSQCTHGLYFKEVGLPYCRFNAYKQNVATAFIAKISEGYNDVYRRTKSASFGNQGRIVEWFKYLGNPNTDFFGTTIDKTGNTISTVPGRIAIHDSDVLVTGHAGTVVGTSVNVADGSSNNVAHYTQTLRFEGVHSTNMTRQEGIYFGSSSDVAFLARLED